MIPEHGASFNFISSGSTEAHVTSTIIQNHE